MKGKNGVVRVLSLGAGVQSSTIALMIAHGEIEPVEFAVFADTGAEPDRVYQYLSWLEKQVPFPVYRVMEKQGLTRNIENYVSGSSSYCSNPPLFLSSPGGESLGLMRRDCTRDFKLVPIRREIRKRAAGRRVVQLIGISTDEARRVKLSRVQYIENDYPLIRFGMDRQDCKAWMFRHYYPTPPRSACVYCPFKCDAEWRLLRDDDPKGWEEACRMDQVMRRFGHNRADTFVHRSCVPLAQVDLSTDEDRGQMLFPFDCEGMCGI